jgi:tetratricopeptide (TPR) repeat protein
VSPEIHEAASGPSYKRGDVIGQKYEVYGVLGSGGIGAAYLVYSHEAREVYVLKTFRDGYLADAKAKERFRKEASAWVGVGRHPHLVRAYHVINIAGRLFVGLEHVAPDESGLNTLEGYLRHRPPDLAQGLHWAVQFCHGMEYAFSKGIRCHHDIKPANIMIGQDKTVRITDFGMAAVPAHTRPLPASLSVRQGTIRLSGPLPEGQGFGTPTHMAPEQFARPASCDARSDIYSFGVVLYQIASGGRLPFLVDLPETALETARFWGDMHRLHEKAPVPVLDSPLSSVIHGCMEKEPGRRYQTFKDLRADLELLFERQVAPPVLEIPEAWEWYNKATSLRCMGRDEEAIRCLDRAIELAPEHEPAWCSKGIILHRLGRYDDAMRCHDRALELSKVRMLPWLQAGSQPSGKNNLAAVWSNRGATLRSLGRDEEAISCYKKALEIDPRDVLAWHNQGNTFHSLGQYEEAISCADRTLELDPMNAAAWNNKANSLSCLGRYEEAIRCCDEALRINAHHALAWWNKGDCLDGLDRREEALACYDKALEINPRLGAAWQRKGNDLQSLGRHQEAARCYDNALEIDPQNANAWANTAISLSVLGRQEEALRCYGTALELEPGAISVWYNKGLLLRELGRLEEAIECADKVIELDPSYAMAWYGRALDLETVGRKEDAAESYRRFIDLAPTEYAEQLAYAQQRYAELCVKPEPPQSQPQTPKTASKGRKFALSRKR